LVSRVKAGLFTLLETTSVHLDRIAELVETCADLPLGTVDASVIALAERLDLSSWRSWIIGTSPSCARAARLRSRSCCGSVPRP
jgi:hypothetical protein